MAATVDSGIARVDAILRELVHRRAHARRQKLSALARLLVSVRPLPVDRQCYALADTPLRCGKRCRG
jgi:hypothetical protein